MTTTIYTCPMHPEIIQKEPGFCPVCGMSLEPKAVTLEVKPNQELIDISKRFWTSLIFTIVILFLTMGMDVPGIASIVHRIPPTISSWIQFILATPVVFWSGWPLFKRAWFSLVQRSLNMFTLIAMGIGAAYGYSIIAICFPDLFPPSF